MSCECFLIIAWCYFKQIWNQQKIILVINICGGAAQTVVEFNDNGFANFNRLW